MVSIKTTEDKDMNNRHDSEERSEEDSADFQLCHDEAYGAWLDSLPTETNIDGNIEEEEFTSIAGNVYNDAFGAYQARIYSSLSAEDLAFFVTHIRQDEAYKCAELCEDIRDQVAISVDKHSAKAAALCSRAIRTKRMGTLTQEDKTTALDRDRVALQKEEA